MRVNVTQHHNGGTTTPYEGAPEAVRKALLAAYPFVVGKVGYHASLAAVLAVLNACQAFTAVPDRTLVKTVTGLLVGAAHPALGHQLGGRPDLDRVLAAAAFLAGATPPDAVVAAARAAHDDDAVAAALAACGLPDDAAHRAALHGVLGAAPLAKAEAEAQPVALHDLQALTPDGADFVAALQRATDAGAVYPVSLGGKHSSGTLLAYDPETHVRVLLKPGAGPQNPAAGAREEGASQAAREAAFYAAAAVFGVQDAVPETHWVAYNGGQAAAIRALDFSAYQNMNAEKKADPNKPRRLLAPFLPGGTLHRWAAVDYVLGNVDRNSGNVLAGPTGDVWLIDHGSAFAGADFSPATDAKTYTPYYLRAFAPPAYKALDADARLKALPRLHPVEASRLGAWLQGVMKDDLQAVLARYGVDPAPALARLAALQQQASYMPPDLAVNAAWAL